MWTHDTVWQGKWSMRSPWPVPCHQEPHSHQWRLVSCFCIHVVLNRTSLTAVTPNSLCGLWRTPHKHRTRAEGMGVRKKIWEEVGTAIYVWQFQYVGENLEFIPCGCLTMSVGKVWFLFTSPLNLKVVRGESGSYRLTGPGCSKAG